MTHPQLVAIVPLVTEISSPSCMELECRADGCGFHYGELGQGLGGLQA
jgi:hypothetical protein